MLKLSFAVRKKNVLNDLAMQLKVSLVGETWFDLQMHKYMFSTHAN